MSELLDNSKKSHGGGPKTPEGKRRSSLNSMRHGLTAQTVVLPHENQDEFDQIVADYTGQYEPATPLELDLVQELAATRWRLQRMWGIETTVLDIAVHRTAARAEEEFKNPSPNIRVALAFMDLAENSRTLALINRYEARLSRRVHQILGELNRIRAARKAEADAAAQASSTAASRKAQNADISESPADPKSLRVVLSIPKKFVRNELPQPVLITRPALEKDIKIPPKEGDAA